MRGLFVVVALALLLGCDGRSLSSVPTAPSPGAASAAPPPPPSTSLPLVLNGYVSDTAYRTLGGATVEVMQGPDAGKVMTSDAQGRFSYTGTFATPVTLRATKEGYAVATETARVFTNGEGAYVSFQLSSLVAPVTVGTNYTLTISADPACTGLPNEARTRTYDVTVTPNAFARTPRTSFQGRVTPGQFAPYGNNFWIGVAGDYVTVSTEGEGPSIVEQIGPTTYIAYLGNAGVSVTTPEVTTIAAPFRGLIEYCELKAPIGAYYDCSPELAEVREQCTSPDSRLTLTGR